MSPRFKGGSDDWLDDQDSSQKGSSKPKKKASKAGFINPDQGNATIIEVFMKQAKTRLDTGESLLCGYRRAQVIQHDDNYRERSPVAVGDRVLVSTLNPQNGIIEGVCSRRNSLVRPAPGKEDQTTFHVVAANIDLIAIVASVTLPEFSPGLVDRYLISAKAAGIDAMICVTKVDLLSDQHGLWNEYEKIGYPILTLSVRSGEGVPELLSKIQEKTVVFCGHSGVGKTSLFRSVLGSEVGKIGEVNVSTGKGRHTTTSAIMYHVGDDSKSSSKWPSKWIDTPGIREFGLVGVTSENLADYFPEFKNLGCTLKNCSHIDRPECEATGLFRYPSFLRIHASLLESEAKLN